jgi:hypothetical protein
MLPTMGMDLGFRGVGADACVHTAIKGGKRFAERRLGDGARD